eukprot:TRINITY_DN36190_c0_g1_i1.p1 TRINITY_DN36190_c0_g1~~TRINITY_DN36190_c0_g1_i1.p1  ORF type:complete len:218 (+),score=14.90 TRINITY_DN36190_c0_g1_i1:160-813(+)
MSSYGLARHFSVRFLHGQIRSCPTPALFSCHRRCSTEVDRVYHYYIDLHGRLFLEDAVPKNIATSLKGVRLLDGFWTRLRRNESLDKEEYPFVSPCMGERNLVKPAAVPVVFHSLENEGPTQSCREQKLVYAGSLKVPFRAAELGIDDEGRLYHRLHGRLATRCGPFGLLASDLAARLAERMSVLPAAGTNEDAVHLQWDEEWFPLMNISQMSHSDP